MQGQVRAGLLQQRTEGTFAFSSSLVTLKPPPGAGRCQDTAAMRLQASCNQQPCFNTIMNPPKIKTLALSQ